MRVTLKLRVVISFAPLRARHGQWIDGKRGRRPRETAGNRVVFGSCAVDGPRLSMVSPSARPRPVPVCGEVGHFGTYGEPLCTLAVRDQASMSETVA